MSLRMSTTKTLVLKLLLVFAMALLVVYTENDDAAEKKVMVCKLFRVEMNDISDALWKILDKLTGEDALTSRNIPRQDAEYCIEGAFRLAPAALPGGGIPASAQGYELYTGETVTDWMLCEEFRLQLLHHPHSGTLVFSPTTGWVYFRLDLQS